MLIDLGNNSWEISENNYSNFSFIELIWLPGIFVNNLPFLGYVHWKLPLPLNFINFVKKNSVKWCYD